MSERLYPVLAVGVCQGATVVIETLCKETGKTTLTTLGTEYHSGKEEPDKKLLNTKVLKKVITEYKEVKA